MRLYAAFNERDEADFVVLARIRDWIAHGGARRECADAVSLQCAVARVRGGAAPGAHALPRLRRPAVLRARRDQGRARLPAADRQPRRRRLLRARREPADARHRRQDPRRLARGRARGRQFAVAAAGAAVAAAPGTRGSLGAAGLPRPDRTPGARSVGPGAARAGRPRDPRQRPHRALPQGEGRARRGARREPGGAGQRRARLRARGANCRRSRASSRTRCSNRRGAGRAGRTACR